MKNPYILDVDRTQNIDDVSNVRRINIDENVDIVQLLGSDKREFENKEIILQANFAQIDKFDYLDSDLGIPVFSENFCTLIRANFIDGIRLIPLVLVDDRYSKDIMTSKDFSDHSLCRRGFFTIKTTRQYDYCDIEKSEFRTLKSRPNEKGILKKPVLKRPNNGFPKLFRIKQSITKLFVNTEVHNIILENQLQGFIFSNVDVI